MTISVENSIKRILTTTFGERMGNPAFGSRMNRLIDKTAGSGWQIDAQRYIREALKQDTRFVVGKITFLLGEKVRIGIAYTHKETNQNQTIEVAL